MKFGDAYVCWIDGTIQGSKLFMGIVLLCGGYIEWDVGKILKASMEFHVKVWMHRYVDDIISQVVVFFRFGQYKEAFAYAQKLLDELLAPYGVHVALKVENADEFIGLKIEDH